MRSIRAAILSIANHTSWNMHVALPAVLLRLWLCSALLYTTKGQSDKVDLGVTLPGYIYVRSSQYGAPVFPTVSRTFTAAASNFVIDWNIVCFCLATISERHFCCISPCYRARWR